MIQFIVATTLPLPSLAQGWSFRQKPKGTEQVDGLFRFFDGSEAPQLQAENLATPFFGDFWYAEF